MRLFIVGPNCGYPEMTGGLYREAELQLISAGYEVVNPSQGKVPGLTWYDHMRQWVTLMMTCDGLALLPGYRTKGQDRGSSALRKLAIDLKFRIKPIDSWLNAEPSVYETQKTPLTQGKPE